LKCASNGDGKWQGRSHRCGDTWVYVYAGYPMWHAGCVRSVHKTSPDLGSVCAALLLSTSSCCWWVNNVLAFMVANSLLGATKASPLSTSANYKYCLCPLWSVPYYTMFVASTISGLCWGRHLSIKFYLRVGLTWGYQKLDPHPFY